MVPNTQNRKFAYWKMIPLALVVGSAALAATQVTSIDFKDDGATSQILIKSNGPVTYEKTENTDDKQIVLDIKGATLAKTASRALDTSSFNSKVNLISPYPVDGQPNDSRVVVQLREMAAADVSQDGNQIKISLPSNGGGGGTASTSTTAPASAQNADAALDGNAPASPPAPKVIQSNKDLAKTNLEAFFQNEGSKRFTGRPVSIQVRDADVVDVFRLIGEASGFNIVVSDEVKGKISLSLVDVPWDQALELVLHTQRLGAERNNNVLRVTTLDNLTKEKTQELQAKLASEASAPRVTRVFPISFAKLDDLVTILTKFGSGTTSSSAAAAAGAAGGTNTTGSTAVVQADPRTNSIVVRDIPENIERMKKLIEILDTQTPQVLIEAKVIEATENFEKDLGGSFGLGNSTGDNQFFGSAFGLDPVAQLIGSNGAAGSFNPLQSAFSTTSGSNIGQVGFSPQVGIFPGIQRLNATLHFAETESKIKVITSPRTVVLDKEHATILQTIPVLVSSVITIPGVGPTVQQSVLQANLSLDVVPTITSEGSILMDLNVSRDVPFTFPNAQVAGAIANRNMKTKVLVASGSTLVMGGIYTSSDTHAESGVPWLRKIPILGMLFGSTSDITGRSELFFFITPRILNPKEAGLSSTST